MLQKYSHTSSYEQWSQTREIQLTDLKKVLKTSLKKFKDQQDPPLFDYKFAWQTLNIILSHEYKEKNITVEL